MTETHLEVWQAPIESAPRRIDASPSLDCSIASLLTQALPFSGGADYGVMDIGKRIKARMKAEKITSKAMADACGVTPSAVSSWFRTGRISKGALAVAAGVLQTSVEELITGEPTGQSLPGASPDAAYVGHWLDKIKDRELRERVAHSCVSLILQSIDRPASEPTQGPRGPTKTTSSGRPKR